MKRLLPIFALLALSAARADVLPGLEAYGDLTLVDEVDCAADAAHEFHEYPEGASSVQTILGSPCRVLPHPSGEAGFFSYRLGKGKGLVAHDMYLLVVEYPDDVPRTANLLNRAMNSRNGWHTGNSVGDTMVAHIVGMTHPESLDVPLSGQYKQLEQVMFLNEKVFPYDTTDSYIDAVQNGFDVIVHVFEQGDALDSAGAAVRAIKLYHVNDESAIRATIKYPTGDVPRRHVTWRDEMGKHNLYTCNDDPFDNLRMKMRLMKALGIDTWSRDLFEFGYNIFWDVSYDNNGHSDWMWPGDHPDYWGREMAIYREAGIYLLPFYEYSGARRSGGFGVDGNAEHKCTPMDRGGYGGHYNLFVSNANGASNANIDVTSQDAYTEFKAILNCTILRYKDQANFIGAWIRNRGSMPVSFSETTRNRFCADTGRASGSVTIEALTNKSSDSEYWRHICKMNQFPALYQEYRTWWYGKRRDWLVAMQGYLENGGLAGAKVYYCGESAEAGPSPHNLAFYDNYYDFLPRENSAWDACGYSGTKTTIEQGAEIYETYGLRTDSMTWYPDEYNHACPRNDCETYTNVSDVALCYPYNCVYTTLPPLAADYRNGSGDLFFSRHFCLYEGCGNGVGYFTTEMDRVGRAIMLPELHAMAHQDPTVIGFMQGGHLARNSTKEFREFNENFLSLPAIKGTLVRGGSWSDAVTIRKYATPAATYYAAINTSGTAQTATCAAPEGPLFATVTGAALPVSGGTATFSLEPYQMLCYTTENPGGTTASAAVSDVTDTTATLAVTVSSLASSSATITVRYSKNANMSGATSLSAVSVSAAGTKTFSLSSLSPSTTYYVQVVVDDGTGSPITLSKTFETAVDASLPAGTVSLGTVGPNTAQIAVALSSFGRNASRADVRVEYDSAPFGARTKTFSGVTSLSSTQLLDGLSTEVEYTASVYARNSLGKESLLGTLVFTTAKVPAAAAGAGVLAPGLVQAKFDASADKTSAIATASGATRVPGAAMAGVAANGTTYATAGYENPYDGQTFRWNAKNTTFGYAGEMFFEAGRTYTIGKSFDDGALVKIAGGQILEHTKWDATATATYAPAATGWAPIEIRVWDGDGGKGPANGWSAFTGLAWSTNASPTISATTTGWIPFMADAGAPLRCRSDIPPLVSLGTLARSGSAVVAPVSVDSYDEDNVLAVYATTTPPAAGEFDEATGTAHDFAGWTRVAGSAPAIGLGQSQNVSISGLALAPGTTVYAVARLTNARTGYDVCSAAATYMVPDDGTPPVFGTCEAKNVAWNAATLSFALSSLGTGSTGATVSWTLAGGAATPSSGTLSFTAAGTKTAALAGLAADTEYTVSATVTGSNGKTATKTFTFRTAARSGPAATLSVGTVGYTDAAFTVNVSSFGTDATGGSILLEVLSGSTVAWSKTENVSATGAKAFSATGLAAGTAYTVRATVTSPAGSVSLGPTSFTTLAYGAPVFGTCEAKSVTWNSATLSFALSDLGAGSAGATVSWTLAGGAATPPSGTLSFTAAGTKTAALAGLAADTQYTVSVTATGSNGKTATKSFTFRTARVPLALGAATGTCDGTGTHGTAKVTVERADVAATLVLRIDGAVAKTWTGVSAGGEYSWDFDLAVGDAKVCTFTLSATGCADVVQSVTVEGRVVVDWFHVPFGDDYEGWTLADGATDPHDGGSWTLSGSRNASAFSTAGGARHIALAAGEGGAVAYAPAFPSEANRTLEISGRAKLRAFSGRPDAVPAGPIAGLALGTADGAPVLFGLSSGGWTALSGATAAADAWVDWSATIDFGAGTVVYRLGGARLSAGGVSALPLASTAAQARRVSFSGSGAVGAFQGVYAEGDDGTVRLYRAAIRVDGTGLEFRTVSGSDRFVIGLKDAQAGLRYVAFAAASLDTPAGDWVCAACSEPAAAGAQVDLPCAVADGEGNPIPAQFFRIYGASEPIAVGTRYGALDVEAGE